MANQDLQYIKNNLSRRLSLLSIHKQHQIITRLNSLFQISLDHLKRLDILRQLSHEQILNVIDEVKYLKIQEQSQNKIKVKIKYDCSLTSLVIGGIKKEYLSTFLENMVERNKMEDNSMQKPKVIEWSGSLALVEAYNIQYLQKLHKNLIFAKGQLSIYPNTNIALHSKKIIVARLDKIDLFTFIVDLKSNHSNQMFRELFRKTDSKRISHKKQSTKIVYRSFFEQRSLNFQHRIRQNCDYITNYQKQPHKLEQKYQNSIQMSHQIESKVEQIINKQHKY